MKNYILKSKKTPHTQKLINEALDILEQVGIPFTKKTEKGLQSMAMCFLAVAGVTKSWKDAKGQNENRHLKTRDIIKFINEHYEENISPGSTRGYTLNSDFKNLIVNYGTGDWGIKLKLFLKNRPSLSELLLRKKDIAKSP